MVVLLTDVRQQRNNRLFLWFLTTVLIFSFVLVVFDQKTINIVKTKTKWAATTTATITKKTKKSSSPPLYDDDDATSSSSSNYYDNTIIDDGTTTTTSTSTSTSTAADTTTSNNNININNNDNNNNNNDDDDNNIVIIGAGLGTTGTHLMFHSTCYMGYKSVHYYDGCIDESSSNDTTTTTNNTNHDEPLDIHKELVFETVRLSRCLQKQSTTEQQQQQNNRTTTLCGDAILWKQSIETMIDRLALDTSTGLVAFHDTPYPYFVDTFVKSIKKHNNRIPIVLLSERSPTEWLKRRIQTQHIFGDIICKGSVGLSSDSTDNTTTTISSSTTSSRTLSSGFDLLGCIDDAINNNKNAAAAAAAGSNNNNTNNNNNNTNLDLKDILVSLKHVSMNNQRGIIKQFDVLNEVRRYQDHVRNQLSNFTYNMFEQINKTDVPTLADMILNEIPVLLQRKSNNNNLSQQHHHHEYRAVWASQVQMKVVTKL